MMTEDEIKQWRDQEQLRINQIVNPYHRKKASDTLQILNAILQDGK